MRLAIASLVVLAATTVSAQPVSVPSPPMAAPAPPASAPMAPPGGAVPAAPGAAAVPAPPAAPEAPPAPPAPPTDPAAIAVLAALENVCVPLVDGGDIAKLSKANGFRKSGDVFVQKQKGLQLTLQPQGSNPDQCHVDIISPVDPDAPAKPIILALNDWAAVSRNWSLYRNDKNVSSGKEFTTRSWETDQNGRHQALVLTTIRKPDGAPSKGSSDTSQMIYSSTKTAT